MSRGRKVFKNDAIVGEALYQVKPEGVMAALKNNTSNNTFWKVVEKQEIATHQPIVHVAVNRYVSIVNSLISGFTIDNEREEELINSIINKENQQSLDKIVRDITKNTLVQGDVCLKIEYDEEVMQHPIITVVPGIDVEYVLKKGRIVEAVFSSLYTDELDNEYILKEYRGRGYIKYRLFDHEGEEVSLELLKDTRDLKDVEYNGGFLFIPVKFLDHPIEQHRGRPLFYDKLDMLSFYDESGSKINTVMRNSEPYTLFNEKAVTTEIRKPVMNNRGQMVEMPVRVKKPYKGSGVLVYNDEMLSDGKFPDMVSFVNINPYAADYELFNKIALENVLLGIMSPETLGIESRTHEQNATAQKDRESITADMANNMAAIVGESIELLIKKLLLFTKHINKDAGINEDVGINMSITEYQVTSFSERASIVKDLRQPFMQNISLYESIKLLFPEKTEQEIEEEIERIESGAVEDDDFGDYLITDEMIDKKYEELDDVIGGNDE